MIIFGSYQRTKKMKTIDMRVTMVLIVVVALAIVSNQRMNPDHPDHIIVKIGWNIEKYHEIKETFCNLNSKQLSK